MAMRLVNDEPTLAPKGPQACGLGPALAYAAGLGYESMKSHFTGGFRYGFQNMSEHVVRLVIFDPDDRDLAAPEGQKGAMNSSPLGHMLTLPPRGREVLVDMQAKKVRVHGYIVDQDSTLQVFWKDRDFLWEAGMIIRVLKKHTAAAEHHDRVMPDDVPPEVHMVPKVSASVQPGRRMGGPARRADASRSPFTALPNKDREILVYSDRQGSWASGTITALHDTDDDERTVDVRDADGRTTRVATDQTPTIIPIDAGNLDECLYVGQAVIVQAQPGGDWIPCRVTEVPRRSERFNPAAIFVVEYSTPGGSMKTKRVRRQELTQCLRPYSLMGCM